MAFLIKDARQGCGEPCDRCDGSGTAKGKTCGWCAGSGNYPHGCELCLDPITEGQLVVCADCGRAVCADHEAIPGVCWGPDEWKEDHTDECSAREKEVA